MLSLVCREIKNWFEKKKFFGVFKIENGAINTDNVILQEGQYFRIVGSVFNDGVYQYPASELHDEVFDGAIWALAIPQEFLDLVLDISNWQAKYGDIDSEAMSPFTSESFGGYSYSKSSGGYSEGSSSTSGTWQSVFASRLNMWRKI